jgi:nitrate/nitrite transport system permease protein
VEKTDSEKSSKKRFTLSTNVKAAGLLLLVVGGFAAVWEFLVYIGATSPMVPPPSMVAAEAVQILSDPFYVVGINDVGIGLQLLTSLGRVMLGFSLAVLVAVPIGFLIGMSPVASKAFNPIIEVLRPVSPLAWLPIGLAVLQDSNSTAIFVIFISSIWPTLINTIFGVKNVPQIYKDVSRTFEADKSIVIRKVLLPATLPSIFTGMKISLGIAWLVIIAAEMLVGGTGIGYFLWNEWNNLNTSAIIVCILLIGAVGISLDRLFTMLERRFKYD